MPQHEVTPFNESPGFGELRKKKKKEKNKIQMLFDTDVVELLLTRGGGMKRNTPFVLS